jgi:predicted helicase
MVRSVHQMLKEDFGKPLGLADSSVTVLDPAAGTLTFIAEAFKIAVNEYKMKYGAGGVKNLIRDHLLKHFYAFELMMAPYAIGHLKMGFILDELGYTLSDEERFKLYLTNTLEMDDLEQTELPGMASLSEESKAAGKIKKDEPVLVILGNPPYSGISSNKGDWILEKIEDYKYVDGEHFGEKKHWLQDDYVKFIRFAQHKIDQNGQGIVAYITNHSYLDNPTFRGMRQSLMESFDEIHVLDLHGNSLKKETAPDGTKDENVFDIRTGVAVNFSVKKEGTDKKVFRDDRYSLRSFKYGWLEDNSKGTSNWKQLNPQSPFYFFKEQDYNLRDKFNKYISLPNLFPANSVGIVTARDKFVIDFEEQSIRTRIQDFVNLKTPDNYIEETYGLKDTSSFTLSDSRVALSKENNWKKFITEILYRPFDKRKIFYNDYLVERSLKEVMQHMISGKNLGICVGRQWGVIGSETYDVVLATDTIIDFNMYRRGGELLFPLYLYSKAEEENSNKKGGGTMMMVFEEGEDYEERRANINKKFYNLLETTYGNRPTPEQILFYTYAVLYAPAYRQTYAEFLKSDFPRVAFTKNYELFSELADLGEELTNLHLMKSEKLHNPIAKFQGEGNNVLGKSKKVGRNYKPEEERVYINDDMQYFEGIPEEVWEYQIGGYQVLDKWLYDRRERKLSNEEIQHYCQVVTALSLTIELQKEIDELYAGVEDEVIQWKADTK